MSKLTKKQQKIYNFLIKHPGYIKKGKERLAVLLHNKYNYDYYDTIEALKQTRLDVGYVPTKKIKLKTIVKQPLHNTESTKKQATIIKRLFFDIETSPNIVSSWNVGYKLNIGYENIIKERAIICICYKWEGDNKVYSLSWDNGDDHDLVYEFSKIIKSADEVVGHNGDNYDIKWFKTRCLYHGIKGIQKIKSIDTLKLARKHFRFNSNRLDYIARFLGLGQKISTGGYDLWQKVIAGNQDALTEMINYCKGDVTLLEKVYDKLEGYSEHKTHAAVMVGGDTCDCPKCASKNTVSDGNYVTSAGTIKKKMQCLDCSKYFTVSKTAYEKRLT